MTKNEYIASIMLESAEYIDKAEELEYLLD